MGPFALVSLISGVVAAAFGVFVYGQDPNRRVNRAFLWLCVTLAYWGLCEFQLRSAASDEAALLWGRAFALWPLTVSAFLGFAVTFARREEDRTSPVGLGLIHGPAVVLTVLGLFTEVVQAPPVRVAWGYTYGLPEDMTVRYVAMAWAVGTAVYSLVLVLRRLGGSTSRAVRRQVVLVAVGLMAPVLAGGITEAALPVFRIRVPEMTNAAFAAGCLCIGLAVWRYGLFRLSGVHVASSVVRSLRDPILAVDLGGKVASANGPACELLGYDEQEIVGLELEELVAEGSDLQLGRLYRGPIDDGEAELRTRDGDLVPVAYAVSKLVSTTGALLGHALVLRDLREQRRAEEQTRLQKQFADAVVHSLPGVFYLIRTDGTFARWNERFEEVTGYSAEELSRMNVVELFEGDEQRLVAERIAEVFESGRSSVEAGFRLKDGRRVPYFFSGSLVVLEGAPHLVGLGVDVSERKRLEQDLLQFSRKQEMRREVVLLAEVVKHLSSMLHRLLGEDVKLSVSAAPELWSVSVDVASIEQVIVNLVVNARDSMQGGAIDLRMTNVEVDPDEGQQARGARPGDYVRLSVIDHGHGIDADHLSHVFEPFFTTKAVGQGTGLGLSVVYGVVQQLEGWIDLTSFVGEGTRFDLYLPRCTSTGLGGELVEEPAVAAPGQRGDAGARVLLVEDDSSVRRFVVAALTRLGYDVVPVINVDEALARFSAEPDRFDLLFSDVVLPDGNGLELARRVRDIAPGLPILLASGYTGERARVEEILELGFGFLQKPCGIAELKQKVASAVEG